jgi:hypothetical protein
MRHRVGRLVLLALLGGSCAFSDVIDQFAFTPTVGSLDAFTFDIVSPDFLAPGALSFAPFTVTDSEGDHTITQGSAGTLTESNVNYLCLDFGSANAVIGPGCTAGANPPNDAVYFALNFYPLPASDMDQVGVYSIASDQYFVFGGIEDGSFDVFARGNMTLTVTQTPEPSTIPTVCVAVGCLLLSRLSRITSSDIVGPVRGSASAR